MSYGQIISQVCVIFMFGDAKQKSDPIIPNLRSLIQKPLVANLLAIPLDRWVLDSIVRLAPRESLNLIELSILRMNLVQVRGQDKLYSGKNVFLSLYLLLPLPLLIMILRLTKFL